LTANDISLIVNGRTLYKEMCVSW